MQAASLAVRLLGRSPKPIDRLLAVARMHRPDLGRYFPGIDLTFQSIAYRIVDGPISACRGFSCIENFRRYYSRANRLYRFRNKSVNESSLLVLGDSFGWQLGAPLPLHFLDVTSV